VPYPHRQTRTANDVAVEGHLEADHLDQWADVLTKSRATRFAQTLSQERTGLVELSGRSEDEREIDPRRTAHQTAPLSSKDLERATPLPRRRIDVAPVERTMGGIGADGRQPGVETGGTPDFVTSSMTLAASSSVNNASPILPPKEEKRAAAISRLSPTPGRRQSNEG